MEELLSRWSPEIAALDTVVAAVVLVLSVLIIGRMRTERRERKKLNTSLEAEIRERDRLLEQMEHAKEIVSRRQYLLSLAIQVRKANDEVLFTTSTMQEEGDREALSELEEAKRQALQRVKVYEAIVPESTERMRSIRELKSSGVTVLVSGDLNHCDLNFTIVDGKVAVVGVPDTEGGSSNLGLSTSSGILISMLLDRYRSLKKNSKTYEHFATQYIREARNLGLAPRNIEDRSGITSGEQQEFLTKNP